MDNRANGPQSEIIGMDKPNTSSAPAAVLWITFVVALGLTVFLYMASRSALNAVEAKTDSKNTLADELASPAYVSVEQKANSFKQAFDILNSLSTNRMSKKDILDGLLANITNDVAINNLAIGQDGTLTIDGATGSYRQVADFMVGLKLYPRISEVKLPSVSLNTGEGSEDKTRVIFSVTAKLDLSKPKPAQVSSPSDSVTDTDSSELDNIPATTPASNDNSTSTGTSSNAVSDTSSNASSDSNSASTSYDAGYGVTVSPSSAGLEGGL